ncbi:hypothetical protein [Caulobacter henricii]|uniref:Uncharacterized protein n=1 Tax=Caulobacter henricii TaxID=69395 RepID=A0A0P0P1P4_9CAUL|nr:hypothetical protein [Caulobacter henricii]ALL14287.1 hypothetical protein AQ619_13555 [Caulobacter henricii]
MSVGVNPCLARTPTGTRALVILTTSMPATTLTLEASRDLRALLEQAEREVETALALPQAQQDLLASSPKGCA